MNLKKLILSASILLSSGMMVFAQKPLVGSWMAPDVMSWSPETDMNLRYNKSTVKLQPRFEDKTLLANSYQQYDGKICNSTIMWNRCGSQPAQGAFDFASYSFTHWQYVDMMVYWAGSAAEGLICPPSATWIDASHANGVKMLGQIFLNGSWGCGPASKEICTQMFKRDNADGRSEFAKQLYQIAKNYGFDGWFINEEYGGGGNEDYKTFFDDYYYYAEQDGNKQYMQWYNASTFPTTTILDGNANTSQFLEYGAKRTADKPEDFVKYFNGLEVVQNGLGGGADLYKILFNKDKHQGSIDLFCPEEHIWKDELKAMGVDVENFDSPSRCGSQAYVAQAKIFANESRYFVNRYNDPTSQAGYDDGQWPGFATTCAERSVIMSKPFFTSFCNGLGKHRFVNGENKGTHDWSHVGMQDILPTWRWWIANNTDGALKVETNWDDAYQFGSSYKISGTLAANVDHVMRLFKTQLAIVAGDKFQFVYKTSTANSLNIQFGTKEGNHALANLPAPTITTNNGWTVAKYDLSSLAGKTVSVIAINIKSATAVDNYSATLGQMMLSGNETATIGKVQNLTMQNKMGVEGGDIRLYWDAPATGADKVHHYDIYTNRNGVRTLVGQTKDCAFWIGNITRTGVSDAGVTVDVVPVSVAQTQGETATLTESLFPEATAPEVNIQTSKSLVTPGTQVTFTALATMSPTSYVWSLPAGATNMTSNGNTMTCTLNTVGMTDVTCAVTNDKGTTNHTETALVEVSSTKELVNLSAGKTIDSASSTDTNEGPQYLIDGDTDPSSISSKWCVSQAEPWVIVDLESIYKIYRFNIFDCKVKEDGDNISDYDIEVSLDKKTWIKVFTKKNNISTFHVDWCKPVVGRYVRWNIHWSQPTTIRVWEFEVWGTETGVQLGDLSTTRIAKDEVTPITVSYDMKGELRASDFNMEIVSSSKNLTFSNLKEDAANSTFSFDAKGTAAGKYPATLKITNNGLTKNYTYTFVVNDAASKNVLLNVTPTEAFNKDYDYSTYKYIDVAISNEEADKMTDGDLTTGVMTTHDAYYQGDDALRFTYVLDKPCMISEFDFTFASADGEDYAIENFNKLVISVSEDGETFKQVYSGSSVKELPVTLDAPVKALKFSVAKQIYGDLQWNEIAAIGSEVSEEVPSTPVFSVESGEYTETQNVEITCETEGAEIHYTTDGTAPTAESAVYTEPIVVDSNMTIKAVAVKGGILSGVASATYTIDLSGYAVHTVKIGEGFTSDVIAENKPASTFTNAALDSQNWKLFTADVQTQGGLPADGLLTTKSGLKYQLADYSANNALVLKNYYEGGNLMFAAPQYATEVYVLAISAEGQSYAEVKVKYTDGTFTAKSFNIGDWYSDNENDGEAYYGLGRIHEGNSDGYSDDEIDGRYKFRLFELTVPTDVEKTISAVRVTNYSNSSIPTVLGVSRKGPDDVSGVDEVDAANGSLSVYPNPVAKSGVLNVTLPQGATEMSLVGLDGGVVASKTVSGNAASLELDNIPSGMYMLIVTGENGRETAKVLVK